MKKDISLSDMCLKLPQKKKWSKGKVKDKAQNAVVLDKPTYDR